MSTTVKISDTARSCARALPVLAVLGGAVIAMPSAHADNKRLNDGVVANVYTVQHQHGCTNNVVINPQLRLAAEWQANDVLNNRALDGDIADLSGSRLHGVCANDEPLFLCDLGTLSARSGITLLNSARPIARSFPPQPQS